MKSRSSFLGLALGCGLLVLLAALAIPAFFWFSGALSPNGSQAASPDVEPVLAQTTAQDPVPTFTVPAPAEAEATAQLPEQTLDQTTPELVGLYQQVSPGVVNIQVFVQQQGEAGLGAGSGFVLDDQGHIVTNNHVVAGAAEVIVVFADGTQMQAEVVGTDADSDLAIVRVDGLPDGVHPLPLGDSDQVQVGEWVVAIGNPFGLGTSMSIGIVSATGRMIESGATPFSIPEAIQTDAAINPGNSGGPLLNLQGQVIGVNAQIATGGARASAGVGFAIPANVARRITPALISNGSYQWPWLGVEGVDVNLFLAEANQLESQFGAYINGVVPGSPAEQAGLQGTRDSTGVDGIQVPVGGDVVIEAAGQPIRSFTDLLTVIMTHAPGDELPLTVVRGGERQQLTIVLAPRPGSAP